jgi:peptide deformylase
MERPITHYNSPILRKKAEPITEITDEIRELATDLIDTCLVHKGLGLAAPQIGVSLRMFVINVPDEENPEEVMPGHPLILINPKLSKPSRDLWEHEEGCISIPDLQGYVARPVGITVDAMGLDGEDIHLELIDWEARVVMHENDHLNGVLFIDRMDKAEKRALDPALRELDKKYKKHKGAS